VASRKGIRPLKKLLPCSWWYDWSQLRAITIHHFHHLLLQQNPEQFDILVPAYPPLSRKLAIKRV